MMRNGPIWGENINHIQSKAKNHLIFKYSQVPNKQVGPNKRVG